MTIGIPFYNAERFLADAIRSIFAQTYQDWELLLVDDGSSDKSLQIARSVDDPRVRVLSDGRNRKLPYRLNQITSEARYDIIGRMDADDIISPNRFEKQMVILRDYKEIDLVTTGVCSLTDDNIPIGVRCGSPNGGLTGRRLLLGRCAVVHAAMLGRKEWFQRNPYNDQLPRAQDHELWVRAFSNNDFRLHILGEALYYYREEGNVAKNKLLGAYRSQRYLCKEYGHLSFSPLELSALTLKSYFKATLVGILAAFNKTNFLLSRRNQPLDDKLLSQFNREIKVVLDTEVPGLD